MSNILCVGGGPAGLYFALLHKKAHPADRVIVVEQNRADATYGWGVVFSDKALTFLADGDAAFVQELLSRLEIWDELTIVHRDVPVKLDGHGFSAIARLELLRLLQQHCLAAGVELRFETRLDRVEVGQYQLIIGSDGVNSAIRRQLADQFQPRSHVLGNKYAWYGTHRVFETLSLIFREHEGGSFVGHAYRFSPEASTFIVECDARTWRQAGFADMTDARSRDYCERVFAADLQGQPLLSNRSAWTGFNVLSNTHWHSGNIVLIGDALRTVHFSIGSGTRLALEDAVALHRAIDDASSVPQALQRFEATRRPVVEKLTTAAANSYDWYEHFPEHMALPPLEFAMSYLTRSGRVTRSDLAKVSPRFLASYEAAGNGPASLRRP